jgi:hypothetical protein
MGDIADVTWSKDSKSLFSTTIFCSPESTLWAIVENHEKLSKIREYKTKIEIVLISKPEGAPSWVDNRAQQIELLSLKGKVQP